MALLDDHGSSVKTSHKTRATPRIRREMAGPVVPCNEQSRDEPFTLRKGIKLGPANRAADMGRKVELRRSGRDLVLAAITPQSGRNLHIWNVYRAERRDQHPQSTTAIIRMSILYSTRRRNHHQIEDLRLPPVQHHRCGEEVGIQSGGVQSPCPFLLTWS